ncbi:hypothetical protein K474DRAFT_1446787 [Panus rudis PR-1116 ss-1]|nr:hypothetical protein K474DRAFT_1446787 [Panus rudis PR-1116 ss-1]
MSSNDMIDQASGVAHVARYVVQSSDVLSDMRINVFEAGSDKVVWYKERFLADDEIIEHIVDNACTTILWTIHRPKRGWYIRVRAPSFPPGVFIPLTPLPRSSPYYTDAALTFACRTGSPAQPQRRAALGTHATASSSTQSIDSDVTLTDGQRDRERHSYPPSSPMTSPTIRPLSDPKIQVTPPEDGDRPAQDSALPRRSRPMSQFVAGRVTNFLMTPHSVAHVPQQAQSVSIFSRMLSALKSHAPHQSFSFTISPIPPVTPSNTPENVHAPVTVPKPVLTFHDRTPVWTVRSTNGDLELDTVLVESLGVEPSFYVACALTYLEFLSEREGYLAASTD